MSRVQARLRERRTAAITIALASGRNSESFRRVEEVRVRELCDLIGGRGDLDRRTFGLCRDEQIAAFRGRTRKPAREQTDSAPNLGETVGFRAQREATSGYSVNRNPLFFVVAGAGFEPATFGL